MSRGKSVSVMIGAAAAILAIAGTAMGGPVPGMVKAKARRATAGHTDAIVTLSNNIAGDGSLQENPDDYGAVTVWSNPLNYDFYDPAGALATSSPTFASSVFLFEAGINRVALADPTWGGAATYPNTGFNAPAVTSPNVASDSDGDGVNDTSDSKFTASTTSGSLNLDFQLKQRVYKPAAGSSVARFQQVYTIFNAGSTPANFKFLKHSDCDMLAAWNPAAAQDVAGSFSSGGTINPYQRVPGAAPAADPTTIGLTSPTAGYKYYAGRSGFDPDGAGPDPAMAYGSDVQIWNAYGVPLSWENYTAGIGYAPVVGELNAAQPPGSAAPWDSFMGLQWEVSIPAGGQKVIETNILYGARGLAGCYPDCDGNGTLNINDFICFQTKFALGDAYADCDGNGTRNINDFICFQTKFALGC